MYEKKMEDPDDILATYVDLFGPREAMTCWYVSSGTRVYEFGSVDQKRAGYNGYIKCLSELLQQQVMVSTEIYYNESYMLMTSTTQQDLSGRAEFQPVALAHVECMVTDREEGVMDVVWNGMSLSLRKLRVNNSVERAVFVAQSLRNNRFDNTPRLEIMYRLAKFRPLNMDEVGLLSADIQATVGSEMRRVGVVTDIEGVSLFHAVQHCLSAEYRMAGWRTRQQCGRAYHRQLNGMDWLVAETEQINVAVFQIGSGALERSVVWDCEWPTILLVCRHDGDKNHYEPMGLRCLDGSFQFVFSPGSVLLDHVLAQTATGSDTTCTIRTDWRSVVRGMSDMGSYTIWELDHLYEMGQLNRVYDEEPDSLAELDDRIRVAQRTMVHVVSEMCRVYGFTREASEYVLPRYCSWSGTSPGHVMTPMTDQRLFADVVAVFWFVLSHGGFEHGDDTRFWDGLAGLLMTEFRAQFTTERNLLVQWMKYDDDIVDVSMNELVLHMTTVQETDIGINMDKTELPVLSSSLRSEQMVPPEHIMSFQHMEGMCPDRMCRDRFVDMSANLRRAEYILAKYSRWPQEPVCSWIYHPDLNACLLGTLGGVGLLRGVDVRAQAGARHLLTTPLKSIHHKILCFYMFPNMWHLLFYSTRWEHWLQSWSNQTNDSIQLFGAGQDARVLRALWRAFDLDARDLVLIEEQPRHLVLYPSGIRKMYARLVNALLRVLNRQKPRDVLTEWWLGSDSTVYLHVQSTKTRSYLRALVHGTKLAAVDFRQSESMFKLTLGGLTVLMLHFQEEIHGG